METITTTPQNPNMAEPEALAMPPDAPAQLALFLARLAETGVTDVLSRPCRIRPAEQPNPDAHAWCATFEHPAAGVCTLWLDEPAARVLADAVETMYLGAHASGPLSDIERGVLDYLAIRTLDALDIRRLLGDLTLVQLDGSADPEPSLAFHLEIAGRRGTASLHLESMAMTPPASGAGPSRAVRPSFAVRLAAVNIPIEDSSLQPGDVLLTGISDFTAPSASPALVTSTGWQVGQGRITRLSPTSLTLHFSGWEQKPTIRAEAAADHVMAEIIVGRVCMDAEALSAAPPGTSIDVPMDPVRVLIGDLTWRGEFVRCDGAIGVHILEPDSC